MAKDNNSSPSSSSSSNNGTTPVCRCRVMYLGSSVPHATKDGLQGIQEPLSDLYPEVGLVDYGSAGIDSWISVWSNGILIENVDDSGREVKRFFPIESLHYCAAVRYVDIPSTTTISNTLPSPLPPPPPPPQSSLNSVTNGSNQATIKNHTNSNHHESMENKSNNNNTKTSSDSKVAKFLPLDSPFLRNTDNFHPPLFACILRRTTGIKVLECHAFICKREPAANALVRCCFHAYADSMYAKQIEESPYSNIGSIKRCRSTSVLDLVDKSDSWNPPDTNHHHKHRSNNLIRNISDDLPPPPPPPHNSHHHQSNGHDHHNDHHQALSEIGAPSTASHSPDEENYPITNGNKAWPGPGAGHGYIIREGPMSTMRPGVMKPRQMIFQHQFMGSPGGPPPQMVAGHHALPPGAIFAPMFGIPMTIRDHEKFLKHSLKKKKKKSKSKMNGIAGGSLLIGPPPPPLPPGSAMMANGIPVNLVQLPQISSQGSGHHHHLHHHDPHAIYAPVSTVYSIRSGLRRRAGPDFGRILPPPPSAEYPIMFATNDREPVYIPAIRPLTPLSNYHHHHKHQAESHYVQYPIQSCGTTPRRDKVHRSLKDRGSRGEDTERESSPSNIGIYKRKGHLNERAFSYSIRQEHRSRSNSLANLQVDDDGVVGCLDDGRVGDHRRNSFNMVDRERSSNHSSGHFERNGGGRSNNGHGLTHRDNNSRESFHNNDCRSEMAGLSQSLANLNVGGSNNVNGNATEAKNVPKTASIKRCKQRNSLGSKGIPIAPPLPPSQAPGMMNGKSSSHS